MAGTLISYRITDKELELLQKELKEGESISLTAARLLRERLGVVVDEDDNTLFEKSTLEEVIESKVNKAINSKEFVNESKVEDCMLAIEALRKENKLVLEENKAIQERLDRFLAIEKFTNDEKRTTRRTKKIVE